MPMSRIYCALGIISGEWFKPLKNVECAFVQSNTAWRMKCTGFGSALARADRHHRHRLSKPRHKRMPREELPRRRLLLRRGYSAHSTALIHRLHLISRYGIDHLRMELTRSTRRLMANPWGAGMASSWNGSCTVMLLCCRCLVMHRTTSGSNAAIPLLATALPRQDVWLELLAYRGATQRGRAHSSAHSWN